jgi:2-polyprenyl-3-methyl-5-hydroxy-6-metoxy-1,4-benzoquinol methylase
MIPDQGKPYYTAYEKRYQSIYSQGVDFWSNFPEEINGIKSILNLFLSQFSGRNNINLIEFGCGEGYTAGIVAEMGIIYTGIDISESAINKARKRWNNKNINFIVGDLTDSSVISENSYDIGLDISALHMGTSKNSLSIANSA